MSNEQKQIKQLECPECKHNEIIRVEYVESIIYYEYSIDYEGNEVEPLDRYTEDQGSVSVYFECTNCKNFDSEIEVFQP